MGHRARLKKERRKIDPDDLELYREKLAKFVTDPEDIEALLDSAEIEALIEAIAKAELAILEVLAAYWKARANGPLIIGPR